MAKQNFKKEDEQLENVNEALSTTGQWIENNANLISWVVLGVVAVVLGCISINNYIIKPKALEAQNENAKCEAYLLKGDFEKALNGDDAECIGFEQIANDYSHYQAGELAALYAGICYFQLGDYEQAANYIKRFSADDLTIDPAAHQLLGDAYVEMQEYDKAIKAYRVAARSGNDLIAPMSLKKEGLVYLKQGDKDAAKSVFMAIKNDYPTSTEAQDIDKYISLAE
ncbi:MAG: tetratricopeptide repeat protein [Paludibacteraceae bacterium]|nr:tetratricopeptide repeat protein [Paludibacteraceae bacterium]